MWLIAEINGPENAHAPEEQRQALVEALKAAGLIVVPLTHARALSIIGYPKSDAAARGLADAPEDFLVDGLHDLVDGWVEA